MINNEAKIKAVLAICLFTISMVIVGSLCYEAGKQDGYREGYNQANEDWINYLNEVWDDFVDAVYLEGYNDGYHDGYLWGWVAAWVEYGADQAFRHPDGGLIP
jgi:hypothetical protein